MSVSKLKKALVGLEENVSLKEWTTFKIGGPARYFLRVEAKEDLIEALKLAKENNLPFFVLGGGSNLLVSDNGFDGLVIKIQSTKYERQDTKIIAQAGAKLNDIVDFSLENSLTGLEWAAGIPGTIGGATRGNASAFNKAMAESVFQVEAFDVDSLKIKRFKKEDCCFGPKTSLFKQNKGLIILSVELQLAKGEKEKIKELINEHLALRKEKHPLEFPSAGCAFENFIASPEEFLKWPKEFEKFREKGVIPTGFLIEQCGLKGKVIGNAQISEKHANFIVNLGGAKAEEVRELIRLAKSKVKEKFGVEIREEIQLLGF